MKICQHCHTIYKKFEYTNCENGCNRKAPFIQADGSPNTLIEPQEIILPRTAEKEIRWVCLTCHAEYTQQEVKVKNFICKQCNTANDLYPFTVRECSVCTQEDGSSRPLPLNAKVCDLCGSVDFKLNQSVILSELRVQNGEKANSSITSQVENSWSGPEAAEFHPTIKEVVKNTNQLSLTFTLLNNNFEETLFGESKSYTLKDLIRNANGFIPDSIYESLLEKYPNELISFTFSDNQFRMDSPLDLMVAELDVKFHPKKMSRKMVSN